MRDRAGRAADCSGRADSGRGDGTVAAAAHCNETEWYDAVIRIVPLPLVGNRPGRAIAAARAGKEGCFSPHTAKRRR